MAICNRCGATIQWATTRNRRNIAIDIRPNANGTVTLQCVQGRQVATVWGDAEKARGRGTQFIVHAATCRASAKAKTYPDAAKRSERRWRDQAPVEPPDDDTRRAAEDAAGVVRLADRRQQRR